MHRVRRRANHCSHELRGNLDETALPNRKDVTPTTGVAPRNRREDLIWTAQDKGHLNCNPTLKIVHEPEPSKNRSSRIE
jgi:hypothetical protein